MINKIKEYFIIKRFKKFSKTISGIYHSSIELLRISKLLSNSYKIELFPFLNVILDYLTLYHKCDREYVNETYKFWAANFPDENEFNSMDSIYEARMAFYTQILNKEIQPRCDWYITNEVPPNIINDPVARCCAAFFDILINPLCVDDYDNAPKIAFEFTELALVSKIFINFYKTISQLTLLLKI